MHCLCPRETIRAFSLIILVSLLLCSGAAWAVFGDGAETDRNLPLKAVEIEGNDRTDTNLILRELDLKIGQPFNREMMDLAWIHLEDLGTFAFVDMEFDDSNGEEVILHVYVEEDLTMAYGPLVRYDRRHKYQLGVWLEETNLRGKGETLRIDLTGLYLQRGQVSWTHPWLMGVKGLEIELGGMAEQSAFVFRPTRQRLGKGNAKLRWKFIDDFFVQAGLGYGQTRYRDDYVWNDPISGAAINYTAGTVSQWETHASVGFDSRNNPWYPSKGVMTEVGLRQWSSDDFDSYLESFADLRLFVPSPLGKHVLALRAWGRRTDGRSHLENNLFFGGPETVRGYQFGGLEGDEGYLLTAEYRVPLFMMPISPRGEMVGVGLHVFGDAGDAWYEGLDPNRALQSWGGGAHLNIDRMQLRFEAARTREGEWVFEFMDHFNF